MPVCRREVKTFDENIKESKSSQESNENMSDDDLPESLDNNGNIVGENPVDI